MNIGDRIRRVTTWTFLATVLCSSALGVPSEVEKSFEKKYPGIEAEDWGQDSHGYWEAKFTVDGIRYRADFDEKGPWIETENSIDFQDLPWSIQRAVLRKFPDEEISEIEQVDNADRGPFFDVEFVRDGNKFDVEFRENLLHVETYNKDTESWNELISTRERQINVDSLNWNEFFIELGVNVVCIVIFACFLYYPRHRDHQMLFLILGFNLFLFPILLLSTGFSAGIGFTIFAMLALVRLRSDSMSKTEVAYLLGALSLTFVNALLVARVSIWGSLIVLLTTWIADHPLVRRNPYQKVNIRFRSPETSKLLDRTFLRQQLSEEYDIEVDEIEVESLQKDEVRLLVLYRERKAKRKPDPR